MSIQSFVRPSALGAIVRQADGEPKVILGELEPIASDLRISGDLKQEHLTVLRYDGQKWTRMGGYWSGKAHRLPLPVAEILLEVSRVLRVNDWFKAQAALLKIDADNRVKARIEREAAEAAQAGLVAQQELELAHA